MIDTTKKISAVSYNGSNLPLATQSRTVTPKTEQQVITGDDGYTLTSVTVEAVTKDIDSNIQSGNIKSGVSILGVEGVLEGNKLPEILNKTVTSLTAGDLIGVTQIPNYAFQDCTNLVSLELPSTIVSIGEYAFDGCNNIESDINLPNQLESIESYAFRDCSKLTSISLPSSLTSIESYAFQNCRGLTSVDFSGCTNLTSIESYAFQYCSGLTGELDFSNCTSLTSIGNSVFWSCRGLTSITLPSSLTSIGYSAFDGCANLKSVIYNGQAPNINQNTFLNCNLIKKYDFRNCTTIPMLYSITSLGHATGCQIIVPDALYNEWTVATNWVALTDVNFVKASEYVE